MSTVMVCPQQRVGFAQCNPYTIDVDRRENWNCYNCRGFGYLARNCKNRGNRIGKRRRLEYGSNRDNGQRRVEEGNRQQNLNGE